MKKNYQMGPTADFRWEKNKSVNSKIDQQKLFSIKNKEQRQNKTNEGTQLFIRQNQSWKEKRGRKHFKNNFTN